MLDLVVRNAFDRDRREHAQHTQGQPRRAEQLRVVFVYRANVATAVDQPGGGDLRGHALVLETRSVRPGGNGSRDGLLRHRAHVPESQVLTLQNGVGNLEILQDVFGKERVLGGVTAEGATVLGPGRIRHAGEGDTLIGPAGRDAEEVVSSFRRAGFKIEAVDRVQDLLWGKLIVNVGINALAAITRVKNGRLPHIEGTRILMARAVEEAVAVAKAKDIRLPYPNPLAKVLEVCQATAGNVASMLQDILNKRTTEISFINGAIVREGEAFGIATPVNLTLTTLVHAIQASYGDRV